MATAASLSPPTVSRSRSRACTLGYSGGIKLARSVSMRSPVACRRLTADSARASSRTHPARFTTPRIRGRKEWNTRCIMAGN